MSFTIALVLLWVVTIYIYIYNIIVLGVVCSESHLSGIPGIACRYRITLLSIIL